MRGWGLWICLGLLLYQGATWELFFWKPFEFIMWLLFCRRPSSYSTQLYRPTFLLRVYRPIHLAFLQNLRIHQSLLQTFEKIIISKNSKNEHLNLSRYKNIAWNSSRKFRITLLSNKFKILNLHIYYHTNTNFAPDFQTLPNSVQLEGLLIQPRVLLLPQSSIALLTIPSAFKDVLCFIFYSCQVFT